jgi:Tfp pilus assembly PilM family ATPase
LRRVLGISLSSNQICFAELAEEDSGIKLENAEAVSVDFDFEDELFRHKSSQKDLSSISGEIQNYLTRRNISNVEIAVTIGTPQAFLLTIPIDYSEGKQSLNSKIYWELSNYFPDSYNDFVINTYRLNSVLPCRESDEFLIIAVQKNTLEFVKRIFKMCNLNLALVDIDHFAAEHAVRRSYSEDITGKNILMVGLRNGRVDYGYICDKKYKFYAYSKYSSEPEFNLSIVRKIKSLLETPELSSGVDAVYLYGDDIKEDTIASILKSAKVRLEIVNPFESIQASDLFLKNELLHKSAFKFAPSCGVALRMLSKN